MKCLVGSQYGTSLHKGEGRSIQCGDQAARLLHQQQTGPVVPGLEGKLHIPIQPPAGHPAKVQGGAAGTAHILAAVIEHPHLPECLIRQFPSAGNGTRGQQAVRQAGGAAHPDGAAVAEGPAAPAGRKTLPAIRIVYHTEDHLSSLRQSQGDGAVAELVNQVGGSIHRIQNPIGVIGVHQGTPRCTSYRMYHWNSSIEGCRWTSL